MQRTKKHEKRDNKILYSEANEKIDLKIKAEAMNFIIDRLTDMYAEKEASIVRELVSNALDACFENKGTVYINLPSHFDNTFSVRDEGCGMSIDDIREIYTQYGASTKADDMNQIGAFGLGAKTPLCYTNTFSVKTVKDGNLIIGNVVRSNEGSSFEVLISEPTEEANGTTISLVVQDNDINRFCEAAETYKRHREFLSSPIVFNDEKKQK